MREKGNMESRNKKGKRGRRSEYNEVQRKGQRGKREKEKEGVNKMKYKRRGPRRKRG